MKQTDYLILVNPENPVPADWRDQIELIEIINSLGEKVTAEKTAYEAYLRLRNDLKAAGLTVDLDSGYRSTEDQQRIRDDFTEEYGAAYVSRYVAVSGYSEHHTGLALDLYLNIENEDVYLNEDLVRYPEEWALIHKRLSAHGFILRYPAGKADITGYSYEPWHIRYVGIQAAEEMYEKGQVLEEYLNRVLSTAAQTDFASSELYSRDDLTKAADIVRKKIETWEGCRLQSIRYAGDERSLQQLAELKKEHSGYTRCICFLTDFHSPVYEEDLKGTAWQPDTGYRDYQFILAGNESGEWQLAGWGY